MNSGEPEFGTLLKYISHSRVGVGERARHKRRHLDHPKCLSLDIKPSRAFKYRAAETHFVKPIPGFTPARLFCRWSQLGHRGWVALDSKNRPPVALIESRKTIGPQRRLSLSGERYAHNSKQTNEIGFKLQKLIVIGQPKSPAVKDIWFGSL